LIHVDALDDVESILDQLCARRASAGRGAAAVTMNFIVFIDDAAHRSWVLERAEHITAKHPSRTIVLDSTSATQGVDVTCERIDLGVAKLGYQSIIGIAQRLTVREVPTVLWWSGARLLASRTFVGLAETANAVIIDSSGQAYGDETLAELCVFTEQHPHVALHDLAYLRLSAWQEMIAQLFDEPARRDDLFALDSLAIESGSPAEALYLGAWLGSRIGWEVLDHHSFRARDGRTIGFERTKNGEKRRILSVVLRGNGSTYAAALCGENVVQVSIEGARAQAPALVPLHAVGNTALVERAILASGSDKLFGEILETLRKLVR
jgi:glucose-6-phosphate dehydrogenase assembly protein OpcA